MQEVTSKVATYFKLTFSQYQTDEDRKNFRKIFMCRHMPHEERDTCHLTYGPYTGWTWKQKKPQKYQIITPIPDVYVAIRYII